MCVLRNFVTRKLQNRIIKIRPKLLGHVGGDHIVSGCTMLASTGYTERSIIAKTLHQEIRERFEHTLYEEVSYSFRAIGITK